MPISWLTRYRIREFFHASFWIAPAATLIGAIICARILRSFDDRFHWICFDFAPEGARAILDAFATSMLTFIVVMASSLLLLVQLVSAGLTPRIIALTFQRPLIRFTLSTLVFSYVMCLATLGRVGNSVPQLTLTFDIASNLLALILFLYFFGAIGMGLRPAQIMRTTAEKAREIIFEIYPAGYDPSNPQDAIHLSMNSSAPAVIVPRDGASGVLLSFDPAGLVAFAARHHAVIELIPRVGDYVARDDPLFKVYTSNLTDQEQLQKMVAFGPERTIERDPRFGFRILVDIACKATSPAINDPTTAVLAIDQIHRLLRAVGMRRLHSGVQVDSRGTIRLIFPTPAWEDFVWLATAEIRQYGADSMRVCQRLYTMLEHLIQNLPEPRRPPLHMHLRLLLGSIERNFSDPEDRNRIRAGFSQNSGLAPDA